MSTSNTEFIASPWWVTSSGSAIDSDYTRSRSGETYTIESIIGRATYKVVSAVVSGVGDSTDWISSYHNNPGHSLDLSIDVGTTWSGTIQVQKTRDGGDSFNVVREYTGSIETSIVDEVPASMYRLYCSARTSGEADVELYK